MKKELIPGWIFMVLVAITASFLSGLVVVGDKHPIEAGVIAIIFGIIIRNFNLIPRFCEEGIKGFEKLLIGGIVLIGASFNYQEIYSHGLNLLLVIIVTMTIGFTIIYFLSRIVKLPHGLATLLAVGTTICGGTAIAVTSPIIKAKEEETSYAIATIAIWGLLAIILYPIIGQFIGASDINFGIFAGTAIHSTPQVVGAGFLFSEMAGKTATAVKLVRNCFLAPVTLLLMMWHTHRKTKIESAETGHKINFLKAFPWFLFGYFLLAWFNTKGYFTPEGIKSFTVTGKFLILLGMVGIGLNTRLTSVKSIGLRPLIIGFIGSVCVAICSVLMIIITS